MKLAQSNRAVRLTVTVHSFAKSLLIFCQPSIRDLVIGWSSKPQLCCRLTISRGLSPRDRSSDDFFDPKKDCRVNLNEIPRTQSCHPVASQRIYLYFRAYLATCSWVKHDVNPRQNRRRLIRHLRTLLRDFPPSGIVSIRKFPPRVYDVLVARERGS